MAIHGPIRCSYIERAMCVCLPACVRVHVCACVCALCTFHFDCILVPVHCFWVAVRLLLLERLCLPTPSTAAEAHVPPPFTAYCASSALLVCIALRVRGAPRASPCPSPARIVCRLRCASLCHGFFPRRRRRRRDSSNALQSCDWPTPPRLLLPLLLLLVLPPLLLLFFGRCIGGAILAFAFVHSGASYCISIMVKIIRMKLKANYN